MSQSTKVIVASDCIDERSLIARVIEQSNATSEIHRMDSLRDALLSSDASRVPFLACCLFMPARLIVSADRGNFEQLCAKRSRIATIALTDEPASALNPIVQDAVIELLPFEDLTPSAALRAVRNAETIAQLEMRIERQRSEIERYSQLLAHDLSAPIGSLQRLLDFSMSALEGPDADGAKTVVARARDAARRVGGILDSLERRTEMERAIGVQKRPLNETIAAAMKSLRDEMAAKGEQLQADVFIDTLPAIAHCPAQFTELFRQLLKNAVTFQDGGDIKVSVSGEERDDEVTVVVEDNGIGIDPDYLEYVFEPLARLHGPQHFPGAGLGLTMCRSVISGVGGRIWAEPAAARGTRIIISLPQKTSVAQAAGHA
jgi:signal transduction histidine kinase